MVVEVKDFGAEVIEASKQAPVLVDFWAPWCGPCRFLGPVLEKLAAEPDVAWTLAKVDTDENPAVAQRYKITSIPAVKLFIDGEVADEFIGALPEPDVRKWLAKALPSPAKQWLDAARAAREQGDDEKARNILEDALRAMPDSADLRLELARLLVFEDAARAKDLIAGTEGADVSLAPLRRALEAVLRLFELRERPESLPESAAKAPYLAVIDLLTKGEVADAIARFVEVVRLDRRFDNDGGRNACLAVFTVLGDQSPVARKGRQALQFALF